MSEKSIRDYAVGALIELQKAADGIKPFNEYVDSTGFREEYVQLYNDAFAILGSIRARAYKLQRRVVYFNREKREPTATSPPPSQERKET